MGGVNRYLEYLKEVAKPFKKLTKLEFLQPDNSVAFSIGSTERQRGYMTKYDTRAFIQSGTLNVSTNNGQRRSATISLDNIDGAFEYSVNKLWFGKRLRLSMGLLLPDNTEFYLPQGVFYIKNPQNIYNSNGKQVSLPLVDKWAMLDGTLGGRLPNTYIVENPKDEATGKITERIKVFNAMRDLLRRSRFTLEKTDDLMQMIDNVTPIFTNYYEGKTYSYQNSDGTIQSDINMTDLPYDITENVGGTIANLILALNNTYVGLCGYDPTGAFRAEPSQDDISDLEKPILWDFSIKKGNLLSITETLKTAEVYNDILVTGESLQNEEVWGRARNYDPASDTNINLIGLKTYVEKKADYWNSEQCAALAEWQLKRKTVLQKSVDISCTQMFHLVENGLISIKRTDKAGAPVERHLINSFSIPIAETGSMTINATSVNDYPRATITKFPNVE